MKKILPLIILFVFSFSAIHAKVTWEISNDGTLTISGTGDMTNYLLRVAPWDSRREEIKKVVIKDGVTNVGSAAFQEFPNIVSAIIGNSVTTIGERAFVDCSSLTSVTMSNSVTSIGATAFGNSGLTSIVIPNSVTSIGNYAFAFCLGLTSVKMSNSVTSIGEKAFQHCERLTSIEIPNSVTSIEKYAFDGCKSLTSITFERSTPPKFGMGVFSLVNNSIPVYVPFGSRAAYREALKDFGFSNIIQPSLSLKGSEEYTQKSQLEDVDVSYTRKFSTNWEALYLPFSLKYEDWKDDFEIAYISSVRQKDNNDDGTIDETKLEFVKLKGGSTAPNTPYIIRAKSSGEKTLSVQNTTLYKAEKNSVECSTTTAKFTFTGIYETITNPYTLSKNRYYVIDSADHTKLSRTTNVTNCPKAFQWYMTISSRNSGYAKYNEVKEISISVLDDEEATGIANIQHASPNTQTYDLNGRRVNENNLKPGMYVKNGRKFVVK